MFPILQFVSAVKCPMPPWFEPKSVVGNWDFTSALAREYKDEIKYTCPEGYVFQVFLSNFCFYPLIKSIATYQNSVIVILALLF